MPEGLRYSREHEWVDKAEGQTVRVGVTDYAQRELGDVVFVEPPEVGTTVQAGDGLGVVESVKAVSDIYSPVTGRVTAVNERLESQPELVNEDPYGDGWIACIELDEEDELDGLLDAADYDRYIRGEG